MQGQDEGAARWSITCKASTRLPGARIFATLGLHAASRLGILDRCRWNVHRLLCPASGWDARAPQAVELGRDQGSSRGRRFTPRDSRSAAHRGPARFLGRLYPAVLLGPTGEVVAESRVTDCTAGDGTLPLAGPLPVDVAPGQAYELSSGEEAPVVAIRYLLGLPLAAPIPHVGVRLGTTRGTNALITRRGAGRRSSRRAGFGDILAIGYQNRPKLFELAIKKRLPLFAEVVEIDERITAEGDVLRAPDPAVLRRQLAEFATRRRRFAGDLPVARLSVCCATRS